MKDCSKCGETKPEDDFYWKVQGEKRQGVCKECHRAYRKQHYQANRAKYISKAKTWKKAHPERLRRHGLLPPDVAELFAAYDGKCWLCQQRPAVCVDHDHSCCPSRSSTERACGGCVRGVLCQPCNTGLGFLGDNLEGLARAVEYLRQYESRKH